MQAGKPALRSRGEGAEGFRHLQEISAFGLFTIRNCAQNFKQAGKPALLLRGNGAEGFLLLQKISPSSFRKNIALPLFEINYTDGRPPALKDSFED